MNDTARSDTSWWIWTLVAVGGAGLVVFALVVGLIVVPPVLANLRTEVARADAPLVLGSDSASVTIAVPEGWLVTADGSSRTRVATPDRGMTVEVELTDLDPAQAVTDAGVAAPLVEPLASGLTVAHGSPVVADGQDPTAAPGLIAAVGPVSGGAVVFFVSSDDLDRYRPALASLLEGVQP